MRVYYNHTDAGGVVYHSCYLTFCEQARSEVFFKNNIFFNKDEGYIVKELKANYLKPAKLGDILTIKSKLLEIKNASLKLHQEIFKDNEKIFEMDIVLVYTKNGKITKIPKEHKKVIDEFR
ncbi:MAG: thioesterase family protein [Nautiliaceae bacterium]